MVSAAVLIYQGHHAVYAQSKGCIDCKMCNVHPKTVLDYHEDYLLELQQGHHIVNAW